MAPSSALELSVFVSMAPVSSEISDLLLFLSYFASQNKEIKFGNYFSDGVV